MDVGVAAQFADPAGGDRTATGQIPGTDPAGEPGDGEDDVEMRALPAAGSGGLVVEVAATQ